MRHLLPVLLSSLLFAAANTAYAATPAIGSWQLCQDIDPEPREVLHLSQDGSGKVVNGDGRWFKVMHTSAGDALALRVYLDERTVSVPMSISADGKQLIKPNRETRTNSTYVRLGNPDKLDCNVK